MWVVKETIGFNFLYLMNGAFTKFNSRFGADFNGRSYYNFNFQKDQAAIGIRIYHRGLPGRPTFSLPANSCRQ